MRARVDTFNGVYVDRETRGLVIRNAQSLAFTIGGIAFIIVALGAMVVLPAVLGFLGLSGLTELLLRLGRWPALFVVLTLWGLRPELKLLFCTANGSSPARM